MKRISGKKGIMFLVPVLAAMLLGLFNGSAAAEDAQWRTRFWNNKHFDGDPVVERHDSAVNFDWGQGSPASGVPDDNFSAKFNRRVNFQPGTYRFTATMDDGMRVYLDHEVIIDSWTDSQEHSVTRDVYVSGGEHDLKVEYYDAGGAAVAKFSWDLVHPEGGTGTGGGEFYPNWKAEYFNNTSLSGAPALVRDDRYLNHNWGSGSPASGVIGNDNFSARWTKTLSGAPGNVHITLTSDDGARLYINNQLIIDNWSVQAAATRSADYYYAGGQVQVRVEYFEQAGEASIDVHLDRSGTTAGVLPQPVPQQPVANCPAPLGMTAYVNVSSLNFRDGPALQFPVLVTLPLCQVVQLTGYRNPVDASSPWVQTIIPDGRTAWANADYLIMGVPLSQQTVLSD